MIGELKERIILQEQVLTADGGGGFTSEWQNIADVPEVYAAVTPLSATEQLRFHKLEANVTHRITIRYRLDAASSMRVLHGAVIYDIVSVMDRGNKRRYLDMLVVERRL